MADKLSKQQRIANDQLRVNKIYDGDEREFSRLYSDCRFLINTYKSNYKGNTKVSVEDAFNEAAYICYSNIKSGKLGLLTAEIKDYISGVMRFKLYDENKKYSGEVEIGEIGDEYDLDDEDKQLIKLRMIVSDFVQKIKEPCKTILEQFYLEGLSYDKILSLLPNFNSLRAVTTKSYKCKNDVADSLRQELIVNNIDLFKTQQP